LAKFKDNELAALMPVIEVGELAHDQAQEFLTRLYASAREGRDDAAKLVEKHGLNTILEEELDAQKKRERLMQSLDAMPGEKAV
jgi:Asp-tRNA(Asn)/Glu-tRNA(Gln) amidotransferase B subunit